MRLFFISMLLILSSVGLAQNQISFGEMKLPVRMTRTLGVSGSLGWNGLVGIGPTFQYYITPHLGMDAGLGLALSGYKFSGRFRYLFLEKNFTPLVGVGYIYSTGLTGSVLELEDEDGSIFIVEVLPSSFIQIVGGFEVVTNNGFFVMANLGYAIQANDNLRYLSGTPSQSAERLLHILLQDGIVIEFSIGYIFGNKGKYKGRF